MNSSLSDLVDELRIVAIDSSVIPAGPTSALPGDLLFVNCHFSVEASAGPLNFLLEEARHDAAQIMRRLVQRGEQNGVAAIVLTCYGHFPVPGAARPARRRVYRLTAHSADLPVDPARITAELFAQAIFEETSELDEVAELLHQNAV